MERLYDQAKDQNVAAIMIYGKTGETKAYTDAACTKQYATSDLQDAFLKRAIIKIGTEYFVPVHFAVAGGVGTVKYTKPNGTTATSADFGTLVSVADA